MLRHTRSTSAVNHIRNSSYNVDMEKTRSGLIKMKKMEPISKMSLMVRHGSFSSVDLGHFPQKVISRKISMLN